MGHSKLRGNSLYEMAARVFFYIFLLKYTFLNVNGYVENVYKGSSQFFGFFSFYKWPGEIHNTGERQGVQGKILHEQGRDKKNNKVNFKNHLYLF